MRILLIVSAALLITGTTAGYTSPAPSRAAPVAPGPRAVVHAEQADFTRPDVAPLSAEGKFQVVSDMAWPGAKVRVFFLGAQF